MRAREVVRLAARLEPLAGEFADRLEHPEALARATQQALLHECLERVKIGAGDLLGSGERAASDEDGQAREEPLLVLAEQVVRPRDRRAQRLLPDFGVAAAAQEVEAFREPLE